MVKKSSDHIIKVENLSFGYSSNIILRDVSFSVGHGEIISIVGPNGGGKTTLLKLLLGFLKPQSGTVLIKGKSPESARKYMGYVPQYMTLDRKFPITVGEVILSGRVRPFGFYTKKDRLRVSEAMEALELCELKNERFSEISGGQIQRMLIARSILSDAEILLLDEPTSNIDSPSQNRLNLILKELSKKMTILIVTHDTGFVSNITDRVFCINKTLAEHPIDDRFSKIVSSSYGNQSFIVRHDTKLNSTGRGNS